MLATTCVPESDRIGAYRWRTSEDEVPVVDAQIKFRQETEDLPKKVGPNDEHWVVEACDPSDSSVVGWATVKKKAANDKGLTDYLKVARQHRRKGIATQLVCSIRGKWRNMPVSDGFTSAGKAFVDALENSIVLHLP